MGKKSDLYTMPSASLWTPQQKRLVSANYTRAYINAPEHLKTMGAQFYPEWQATAEHIGSHLGLSTEHGAAILAHLSPSMEAEQNRVMALQLTHGVSDRQAGHIHRAAEHATAARSAENTARQALKKGDTGRHSRFMEQYETESAAAGAARSRAGLGDTALGFQSSGAISKALRVKEGMADPLASLGRVKLFDFGSTIADLGHPNPAVDTHFHDAGVGRTDIPYEAERGLSSLGRYQQFQGASERARQSIMRQTGEDVPMHAFMGGIWYGHQQRKVMENPAALKARKSAETKLETMRSRNQSFLPERFGLAPAFGKIATSW